MVVGIAPCLLLAQYVQPPLVPQPMNSCTRRPMVARFATLVSLFLICQCDWKGDGKVRRRMMFLGKGDPQDSDLLFDGHGLVLTRKYQKKNQQFGGDTYHFT